MDESGDAVDKKVLSSIITKSLNHVSFFRLASLYEHPVVKSRGEKELVELLKVFVDGTIKSFLDGYEAKSAVVLKKHGLHTFGMLTK